MLDRWGAERLRLKLRVQEQQARHTLDTIAYIRQETCGRYDPARQWYISQRQLQAKAKALAQLAGLVSLGCGVGGGGRLAQEERQRRVARGGSFVKTVEAAGRQALQGAARGGLKLLPAPWGRIERAEWASWG